MKGQGVLWTVIVIIVIAAGLWLSGMFGKGLANNSADYQAVFLANGQVYFGQLEKSSDIYRLTDIYYLQVQRQIQPDTGEEKPDVKLIKLGNEVHGPEDEMRISTDQIVFVEDLKDDGKVVTAIKEFERSGGSSNSSSTEVSQ